MPSRGIPEIVRRKVELQSMSQQGQEWKSGSRRHVPELVELDQLMNDEEEDDGQEDIDGSEVFRKESCVNRHDIRGSTRVSRNGNKHKMELHRTAQVCWPAIKTTGSPSNALAGPGHVT